MSGSRAFSFAGQAFIARQSGALWWPDRRMLVVADLHLGRSQRYARRFGLLLPPWHEADTLARLAAEIAALDPALVVSLGDGFDDLEAAAALEPAVVASLQALAMGREFIWLSGNHDPGPLPPGLPGDHRHDLPGPITLRHEMRAGGPDISAHLHPVAPLAGRRWRCFALTPNHLVLPAFGQFTGGLAVNDPAFLAYLPQGIAICCSPAMFALPFPAPVKRRR